MSWLGDVFDFEQFNAQRWGDQIKKNPFRLAYGSADPFSTKVWNGILGTNDKPMVDQFGGAPKQRYQEAQDAGINTGPGGTMHGVARTIASMYAGGAAGRAMGGGAMGGTGDGGLGGYTDGGTVVDLGGTSLEGMDQMGAAQSPGLFEQMKTGLSTANKNMEPYMKAYQNGQQVAGLFQQPERPPVQAPSPAPSMNNNDVMNGLLSQMFQEAQLQQSADMQRKQRRQQLIGGMNARLA